MTKKTAEIEPAKFKLLFSRLLALELEKVYFAFTLTFAYESKIKQTQG